MVSGHPYFFPIIAELSPGFRFPPVPHDELSHSHGHRAVDELVIVVHGVGDPQPGETLSLFSRSVAEAHHPLTEHQEILWLTDEPDNPQDRDVATFPCHTRHLAFGDYRSTLAEVYWGDLSRVNRGILGVLSGLISIVFGLRYVAFVAAEQTGWAVRGLQALGLICSRTLHGPVLAVNFVLAMLILTVAGTEAMWPGSSHVARWANLLIIGCVLVCLLASFLGWKLTHNSVCHRFWYWVMVTSMFVNALMMWNLLTQRTFPLVDYCNVMVTMLGFQWIALVAGLLVMFGCWFCALFQKGVYRPALHVAFILPAMAVGIWGQVLPMMWLSGSSSVLSLIRPVVESESLADEIEPPGPAPANLWNLMLKGLATPSPVATAPAAPDDKSAVVRQQLKQMFDNAVPLFGVQFLMTLFLGAVLIAQLGRYMKWADKTTIEQFQGGRRPPRLIVNEVIQFLLITCATIGMILVMYLGIHEFVVGHHDEEDWLCAWTTEANKYAVGFLVPIAGVLVVSLRFLRPALDILLDVINHFYFRSATSDDRRKNHGEDYDIDEVTFNRGEYYFSRRDSIHRRMKRILDYYRRTIPGKPALTIVSHSQGSIIAIEVLNDEELDWTRDKFSRVNFITLGSPFTHIYQQYFTHFYPALDTPAWKNFRDRVSRWLNIFRIDDYVGTDIRFPDSLPQAVRGDYTNHAVARRGHSYYWRDRQVLEIIRQHNICRSLSSNPATPQRAAA